MWAGGRVSAAMPVLGICIDKMLLQRRQPTTIVRHDLPTWGTWD